MTKERDAIQRIYATSSRLSCYQCEVVLLGPDIRSPRRDILARASLVHQVLRREHVGEERAAMENALLLAVSASAWSGVNSGFSGPIRRTGAPGGAPM